MSNKIFKAEDLSKQELYNLWFEQNERRIKVEDEVRRLQKDSDYWRREAEKLERFWRAEIKKRR